MSLSRRQLLLGSEKTGYRSALWPLLAIGLFVTTFTAYALDVFTISGGVVWIPGDAAFVGFAASTLVGYRNGGLVAAWLITLASLLGYRADHAFFGLSSRSSPERLAYFLKLDGLFVLAIEALVIGTIAFLLGALGHWGITRLRSDTVSAFRD